MTFATRPIEPNDHVLIVLGHHGHPTFKTVDTDEAYLERLGRLMVETSKSQFIRYKIVSSHNVFSLTNPDYTFDQFIDQIVRDLILHKNTHDSLFS